MTFKYEEIKIEVKGTFNDVMIVVNNEKILKLLHAKYVIEFFSIHLKFHQKY